jgi:transcriptional regulator with XRE-family HTH domain
MLEKQIPKSLKNLDAEKEMKLLGLRIKELRKKKGYTSYETFANEHDIHRVQWGRYELGQDLYFSTLVKVIKVLNVTIEEFFSEGFK